MRRIILDLDDWIGSSDNMFCAVDVNQMLSQIKHYERLGFEVVLTRSDGEPAPDEGPSPNVSSKTLSGMNLLDIMDLISSHVLICEAPFSHRGLLVDDKAITPYEFVRHSYDQILKLVS
jgi:hypothetical protein